MGVLIANSYKRVLNLTSNLFELYPNHVLLLKMYALFLHDVMNNSNAAQDYFKKARAVSESDMKNFKKINESQESDFGYNSGTTIFVISASNNYTGLIQYVNFEVKNLLKYKGSELTGNNIKVIMPYIFSQFHDDFINSYIETNQAKILEKKRTLFARDKNGFLVLIKLLVKAIPNLRHNKIVFTGFMRRIGKDHTLNMVPTQF